MCYMKYSLEKLIQEVNDAMKRADMVNDAFSHIFGEPTPREEYEAREIESMREREA